MSIVVPGLDFRGMHPRLPRNLVNTTRRELKTELQLASAKLYPVSSSVGWITVSRGWHQVATVVCLTAATCISYGAYPVL
jgi:hypothetical protein